VDERRLAAIAYSYHRSLPADARCVGGQEDLYQSAALKMLMVQCRYDASKSSYSTFMHRVIENYLRDEYKRISRCAREVKVDFSEFDSSSFHDLEVRRRESERAVEQFLLALSDEAREAFELLAVGKVRQAKRQLLRHRVEIVETAGAMGVTVDDLLAVFAR